jgi:hypothetical protein
MGEHSFKAGPVLIVSLWGHPVKSIGLELLLSLAWLQAGEVPEHLTGANEAHSVCHKVVNNPHVSCGTACLAVSCGVLCVGW